jgi:hypothetical protein
MGRLNAIMIRIITVTLRDANLKMEVIYSPKTLVTTYKTIRCYNPEAAMNITRYRSDFFKSKVELNPHIYNT